MQKRTMITDKVNDSLNEIVKKCFETNRVLDRIMSQLSVKFTMNNSSSILHPLLAHYFPLFADKFSDYQDARNALTIYGLTPKDDTDYDNALSMFERYLNTVKELENTIINSIDVCIEESDTMTRVFLENALRDLIPYTAQGILLCDKIEAYGDNPQGRMAFDHNIESFIIIKE